MRHRLQPFVLVATLGALMGCAAKVRVPPRVDLKPFEVIGVYDFRCDADAELGAFASRVFTDTARSDQGLIRVVDLGTQDRALDEAALRALTQEHPVRTVFTGQLQVSKARPAVKIGSRLDSLNLSAKVTATLSVQLVEAATGASLWSASATATHNVANVSYYGADDLVLKADDPERAYSDLVYSLARLVTPDFRAAWVKQKQVR